MALHKQLMIIAGFFLLASCNSQESKIERANQLMRAHVASDVTVDIDPGTEKLFPEIGLSNNGDNYYYVCGRAFVTQPSRLNHVPQRLIMTVNTSIDNGLAIFDGSDDKDTRSDFDQEWAQRCRGYNLPKERGPKPSPSAQLTLDAPSTQTTNEGPYSWEFFAKRNQMVTNGVDHFAVIESTNAVSFAPPYEGEQHAHLVVRKTADEKQYEVFIFVEKGQLLGSDEGNDTLAKLDDAPSATFKADRPDDDDPTTLFFANAPNTTPAIMNGKPDYRKWVNSWPLQNFVAKIQNARTLKVQVTTYQNGSPVFVFNVVGFSLAKLDATQPPVSVGSK